MTAAINSVSMNAQSMENASKVNANAMITTMVRTVRCS